MPNKLPDLNLTLGQVLWAVRYGTETDQRLKNDVRYLRMLDIPQASGAQADGPGRRVSYGFADLIEVGLAVTALDLGLRPKDVAVVLVENRAKMRETYAQAWQELPETAIEADWVKSRGRIQVLFDDDVCVRFHDRRSAEWGQLDLVSADEAGKSLGPLAPVERFGDEAPRPLLPLKRLMLQWVAWALEAPEIRPGRK